MMKNNFSRRRQVVTTFLSACIRQKVSPFRYFYIHLHHAAGESSIYSKQTINENIPSQWQLRSVLLPYKKNIDWWIGSITKKFSFPLFLKPEWGENSIGVHRITSHQELMMICKKIRATKQNYICQQAGEGAYEYDFFFIKGEKNDFPALFTCTQMHFSTEKDQKGNISQSFINGVNHGTTYTNETTHIQKKDQQTIWNHLQKLGEFQFARVGISAGSLEKIIQGHFHVIEINIFTPMPLSVLEQGLSSSEQKKRLASYMNILMKSVKMKKNIPSYAFWKMIKLVWQKNTRLLLHK